MKNRILELVDKFIDETPDELKWNVLKEIGADEVVIAEVMKWLSEKNQSELDEIEKTIETRI